ncbi:sortase-dependent protein [Streptomyces sp. NPDC002766]|uniref:sortase-dependent protein n=1 Tax=unclassified Streptomyces TaxID=2593676 RepID=UPI003321BEA5
MRRTGLSALALACTAVLAGAMPAFADGASQAPSPVPSAATPTERPSTSTEPSPVPSVPGRRASAEPTRAPSRGQVSVVPSGAPNTGVADTSSGSGGALIGGGAAAAVVVGGGAVLLLRRRRANGA